MKLVVDIVTPLEALVNKAVKLGYLRDDPTKAWTLAEQKRAIKWLLERMAQEAVQ